MKTITKVLIGAGALGVLYVSGKSAVKAMCMAAPQSVPATLLQAATQAIVPGVTMTPDAQCELMASAVPITTMIKVGAIQFWRPLTPADLA